MSDSCRKKYIFHCEIVQDEDKLWQAAREGNVEEVKSLSSSIFVDANCVRVHGQTPLHFAAQHGNKGVVKLLLNRGAKPNSVMEDGWTPLHYAVFWGCKDVVHLLRNAGAKPNKLNSLGKTPRHYASELAKRDVLQLLLDTGSS